MLKSLLCRIGFFQFCEIEDESADRLVEKIKIVLYKANTVEHFYVSKRLIKQYEVLTHNKQYPLTMVSQCVILNKLWERKFKLWKRG